MLYESYAEPYINSVKLAELDEGDAGIDTWILLSRREHDFV